MLIIDLILLNLFYTIYNIRSFLFCSLLLLLRNFLFSLYWIIIRLNLIRGCILTLINIFYFIISKLNLYFLWIFSLLIFNFVYIVCVIGFWLLTPSLQLKISIYSRNVILKMDGFWCLQRYTVSDLLSINEIRVITTRINL